MSKITFDRELSLKLDEVIILLDSSSTSQELRALFQARKAVLERRIFEQYEVPTPASCPDSETWQTIRKAILRRDGYHCALCLADDETLDVHHLIAVAQGGETIPANLLTLCRSCHEIIHPWIAGKDSPNAR